MANPSEVDLLGDEIARLSARANIVSHRLLTHIRWFDEIDGWFRQGAQSCAHWLSWRIGLDRGTAREKVRVARALGKLPRIDAAFAEGRLSYAKVRAITRVATPENEEGMLDVSLAATGGQLEKICCAVRKATEPEAVMAKERQVRARVLGSGLVKLEVVVSADEADLVIQAIERVRAVITPPKPESDVATAATEKTPAVLRPSAADALVHLASAVLEGGDGAVDAASPGDCQVVIHVDRDLTAPEGTLSARLEDGTPVSAETLRRVCCDGGVVAALVDQQGTVLNVGRRTRAIPTAIRRALWIRDQGCRFPGCVNQRYVHGHHIQHWLHGGPTSVDNLVLLCSFHHRLLHEAGFSVTLLADGEVEVRKPQGTVLPAHPTLVPDPGIVDWSGVAEEWTGDPDEPDVDEWTTMPYYDGERMDLDFIVHELT